MMIYGSLEKNIYKNASERDYFENHDVTQFSTTHSTYPFYKIAFKQRIYQIGFSKMVKYLVEKETRYNIQLYIFFH